NRLIRKFGTIADVFVTNFSRKFLNGKTIINRLDIEEGIIEDYFSKVLFRDIIHTSCVCVRKKALDKVGYFDTRISRGEDLDLWMRLNRGGKTAYSPLVTEYYLQDAVNNSRKKFPIKESLAFYINKNEVQSRSELLYLKK